MLQRRADWEALHAQIEAAFYSLLASKKRIPTQAELADFCKVDRITIHRHMKEMDLSKVTHRARLLGERVIMGIANAAMEGDARAGKLYFEIVYNWMPKLALEVRSVDELSEDQLEQRIHELIAETGVSPAAGGEATPAEGTEVAG